MSELKKKELTLEERIERDINYLFIFLRRLSVKPDKLKFANFILSSTEQQLATDKDFYSPAGKKLMKTFKSNFMSKIDTDDEDLFALIEIETDSPFSVFKTVMKYDIPDITMSYSSIKIQYSSAYFKDIKVPREVREIYIRFINHFIDNQKFISESKFDAGQGILDMAFENFRFNIVHGSLNAFGSPIITIRKHIKNVSKGTTPDDYKNYENNLGVPEDIVEIMKKNSNSSFCIFGDVGSGKTTLLRHLTNYDYANKRNVCVIEDSSELFIDTPLSFITNKHYSIHDLFVASLRQNPSHLIIGETRTAEIVDIMETGLTACVSTTIHAQSFEKAVERIYFMSSPRHISKSDIVDLIASSINMFVHIEKRIVQGVWVRNREKNKSIYELYDQIFENKKE